MAEWLSSAVAWPSHQRAYWNETLQAARDCNWLFKPGKNHVFGTIACRPTSHGLDKTKVCSEVIFRTGGNNAEKVAKQMTRIVRSCPHGKPQLGVASNEAAATALLKEAHVLMDGAEKLISADRHFAQAEENLAQAEEQADAADSLLGEAAVLEDQGIEQEQSGRALIAAFEPSASNASAALDGTDARLSEAASIDRQNELKGRIGAAKVRSKNLRTRLPTL